MHVHIVWALIASIAMLVIGHVKGFCRGRSATWAEGNIAGRKSGEATGFRLGLVASEPTIIDLRLRVQNLEDLLAINQPREGWN